MSNESFMEKLLEGVEVEWKALGEVFDIVNGAFLGVGYRIRWCDLARHDAGRASAHIKWGGNSN